MKPDAEGREEVERQRADFERRAIGPQGSSVMLGPAGVEVFFKVDWAGAMERVAAHAKRHGEIFDCLTQWGGIRTEEIIAVLTIEWPVVSTEIVLYLPLAKWRTELGMVRDSGGVMTLISPTMKGMEMLKGGIAVEAELHLLPEMLAAYDHIKQQR